MLETTPDDGTAGSAAPDNCDIDVAAVEGAGEVRREIEEDGTPDNSVDQKEVGRVLADLGNGIVAGSVQTGTPQSVDLTPSKSQRYRISDGRDHTQPSVYKL